MADRTPHVVKLTDDPLVNWIHTPTFEFADEVEALQMLETLSEELRVARTQVRHCTEYIAVAIQAAGKVREDGKAISKQAIIGASGLARQTVYDMLADG